MPYALVNLNAMKTAQLSYNTHSVLRIYTAVIFVVVFFDPSESRENSHCVNEQIFAYTWPKRAKSKLPCFNKF